MTSDFAIFIMVWGRPDKMWTYDTLRNSGYTGKVYFVADDLDVTVDQYKKIYGEDLLVFSKEKEAQFMDSGDNINDYRSTLYAANTIPKLAKEKGIKYFMIMCDDYTSFRYRIDPSLKYVTNRTVKSLDSILEVLLEYYNKTNALTVAFSQGGDFIGGVNSAIISNGIKSRRKAMNTFFCSTDRPIKFMGKMNEDVTTYTYLGSQGKLFLTIPNVCVEQLATQSVAGGLTEMYLDSGTYQKSFYSVMYCPSSVKVSLMGAVQKRIHHKINWNNAVPVILNEKYKKVVD